MAADGIFLRNCWYVAAWDHELIDGTRLARTIMLNVSSNGVRAAGKSE